MEWIKCVDGEHFPMSENEIAEHIAMQNQLLADEKNGLIKHYREKRNELLILSDWTQLPNAKVSDPQSWEVYRQALRDIPQQEGFPENINWPVAPGA